MVPQVGGPERSVRAPVVAQRLRTCVVFVGGWSHAGKRDMDRFWEELAAVLAGAVRTSDVVSAVADLAPTAFGCEMVNVSLLDTRGEQLRLVRSVHTPEDVRRDFAVYSATGPFPSTDALRSGEPVLLGSLQERDERYPVLKDIELDEQSFAIVPLMWRGASFGVLGLGWRSPRGFDAATVAQLRRLADVCAAALERTRAYQREQAARRRAERVSRRLATLYELSTQLAATSDSREVARLVVERCMPALEASAATITAYDGVHPAQHLAAVGLPVNTGQVSPAMFEEQPLVRELTAQRTAVLVQSHRDRDLRYPGFPAAGVRQQAWANLPLVVGERLVGILAFGWDRPRRFTGQDRRFLSALATHTAIALDRAQLMETSSTIAETLQRALLPQEMIKVPGFDLASSYRPAVDGTLVGGDWYDAFTLQDGRIALVVGDVMGKGVQAATIMSAARASLRTLVCTDPDPGQVLSGLHRCLDAYEVPGFITCVYALLKPSTGLLAYASAGHPPALHIRASRPTGEWLNQESGPPLGVSAHLWTTGTVQLAEGDVLVMYSDGLVETRTESLDQGLQRLAVAARQLTTGSLPDGARHLVHILTDDQNRDDIAVLCLRRQPTGNSDETFS